MLLEKLTKHTGLSHKQLEWYALTASKRYKSYQIPKRSGGFRTIHQPSKALKSIQRWINVNLLKLLPVHESATAYKKGASVRLNAIRHINSNYTLRVDFRDFFPSFKSKHVTAFLRRQREARGLILSDRDIQFICYIVARNGELTIGAPSSPLLTNAMMFDFDTTVDKWCSTNQMIYTRYADDIFISTSYPQQLENALQMLQQIVANFDYSSLEINKDKTRFLSRKHRRAVTGLVITTDRKLSIGRERKHSLKSDVYKFARNMLPAEDWGRLAGMVAYASDADPDFYKILIKKYGATTMEDIKFLRGIEPR